MKLHPIPTDTSDISKNLNAVGSQIATAAHSVRRNPDDVCLIAVSKTQSSEAVNEAISAGQLHFGENYLQESLDKIAAITDPRVVWHFIGAIQSNKTRALAQHFHWIHTVERLKIAQRLHEQCPAAKRLEICIQVNVDDDPNKAGVAPGQTATLLDACLSLSRLRVRGLMTILDPNTDPAIGYRRLHDLFETLRPQAAPPWDTLSMGMSGDFPAAIACGATHVRIGTAIFGARQTPARPPARRPS